MKNRDKSIKMTFVEYFAGIGLVRLGLEKVGWKVLLANDISDKKFEMYSGYYDKAGEHYFVRDIYDLDHKNIPSTTLATCSFPCVDLSLAGKMDGINGKSSSAFWGFIKILEEQGEHKPKFILLENVPGWLQSNNGEDFALTIAALDKLGYAFDVFTLNALGFTPQSRLRVFVIGMLIDDPNKNYFILHKRPKSLATNTLISAVMQNRDLSWHFLNIPSPPPLNRNGLQDIIEQMSDNDERWWSTEKVEHHISMMAPSHYERLQRLINEPKLTYRTLYRRKRQGKQRAEIRKGDTAGCLRTAIGGSSRQIVLAAGLGKLMMRFMTPREYARLQGVPDDYPIPDNIIQALTGFGDAVCVPAIEWIAKNVLNPLIK